MASSSIQTSPQQLASSVIDNAATQKRREIDHCPRILSLDGGGVRGLSSLLILREIMEEIQRRNGSLDVPLPCEYFDLIGGTSTGGLIAVMLGRLRMSVEDCIAKYIELSERVFRKDQVVAGVIPTGDDCCRFDAEILETVIKELVEERLNDANAAMADTSESRCPTFVVATSATSADGPAVIFRSYGCKGYNANKCKIWQAARCTSAAPSFFKPMFVEIPAPGGWFLDGGLRHNNPSQLALDEALRLWPTVKRSCLVSIGTGRQRNVEFVDIKDSDVPRENESKRSIFSGLSRIPGAKSLLGLKRVPNGAMELAKIGRACVEMSTSSEPVHQSLFRLANSHDIHLRFPYHRFNVDRGMDAIGLEEWKAKVTMAAFTTRYMTEGEGEMKRNACVQDLLNPGRVERT